MCFLSFCYQKAIKGVLSAREKRSFSYLYYTSYPWNVQGIFTKNEKISILVIKQPICNIHNPNPLILVFIMPGAGDYHFGVGILDLEQG